MNTRACSLLATELHVGHRCTRFMRATTFDATLESAKQTNKQTMTEPKRTRTVYLVLFDYSLAIQ